MEGETHLSLQTSHIVVPGGYARSAELLLHIFIVTVHRDSLTGRSFTVIYNALKLVFLAGGICRLN